MEVNIFIEIKGEPNLPQCEGRDLTLFGPGQKVLLHVPNATAKMVGPLHEQAPGTQTYNIVGDATVMSEDLRRAIVQGGGRVVWPMPGEGAQASEGLSNNSTEEKP